MNAHSLIQITNSRSVVKKLVEPDGSGFRPFYYIKFMSTEMYHSETDSLGVVDTLHNASFYANRKDAEDEIAKLSVSFVQKNKPRIAVIKV